VQCTRRQNSATARKNFIAGNTIQNKMAIAMPFYFDATKQRAVRALFYIQGE